MTKGTPRFRKLLEIAHSLGFTDVGWRGNGHFRVSHPNGGIYDLSGTPGDLRGDRNTVSVLEKIAGRKVPRSNAARYRHEARRSGFTSTFAHRRAGESSRLVERASVLRGEFAELAAGDVSRSSAELARRIVREYSLLESEASSCYVTLPPLY